MRCPAVSRGNCARWAYSAVRPCSSICPAAATRLLHPTQQVISAEEYDLSVGGLGRLIAFNVADRVAYTYENDANILTMIKYMKEESHDDPSDE